jgi:hypothetical protein
MDAHLLALSGYPSVRDIVSRMALTFFAFLGFGIVSFTAKISPTRPTSCRAPCTWRSASPP